MLTQKDPAAAKLVRKQCLLWDWTNTRDPPTAALAELKSKATSSPSAFPFRSVHNWNAWAPPELADLGLEFRPMVRTPAQLEGSEWDMIVQAVAARCQQQ